MTMTEQELDDAHNALKVLERIINKPYSLNPYVAERYDVLAEWLNEHRKRRGVCCLCKKPFYGYGNNPRPVEGEWREEDECCDECNANFVLPERFIKK
jgi:hypothetical protein